MLISTRNMIALLGSPISHTYSPHLFNDHLFPVSEQKDSLYMALDIPSAKLGEAVNTLRLLDVRGFNVTLPHKEGIMQFLDDVDELALRIGAVNTVVNINRKLKGYNTDAPGYIASLKRDMGLTDLSQQRVVILGAGGAARAISFALAEEGVSKITLANRTLERGQHLISDLKSYNFSPKLYAKELSDIRDSIEEATLLINATSVGMYPNIDQRVLPAKFLHSGLIVSDIIYNPRETLLLMDAKKAGARIHAGMGMLKAQANLSYDIWFSR